MLPNPSGQMSFCLTNIGLVLITRTFVQYCTIFKTFKVQDYFSLKDETPLALQANVVYLFEGSCDKNQTYIGKKRHLATRDREHFSGCSAIFNIYLAAAHAIILPLRIFIFCHMVTMILIIK